jgi:type IV pilus assembly protein PilO
VQESIELRLLGNYHGFGEFVSNISNMPRIVTLHDFSIKAHKNDQNEIDPTGVLEMTVILKTYWAKPPGKKPA